MKLTISIEDYLCDLVNDPRLYLLCSPHGFGRHKLYMYISHLYEERHIGRTIVHTLEKTEEEWKKSMLLYGFNMSGLYIDDNSRCSVEAISHNIEMYSPAIVMVHYLDLFDDEDSIPKLKHLATDYSIPIIVSFNLARNCGDNDPMYRRPQLFDLIYTNYYAKKSINQLREDLSGSEILFLHRNHDCDRGIGTAYRYNFSEMAELIITSKDMFSGPHSIFFNYGVIFQEFNDKV